MNKAFFIISILLLAVGCVKKQAVQPAVNFSPMPVSVENPTPTQPQIIVTGQTYANKQYGFEISAPMSVSWLEENNKRLHVFRVTQDANTSKYMMVGIRDWSKNNNGDIKDGLFGEKLQNYEFDGGGDTFNLPPQKMVSLGGLKAGYYVYDNPGCDYGECSQSFVAIVAFKNNLAYELYFFGDAKLDQDELKSLNSFKFIAGK